VFCLFNVTIFFGGGGGLILRIQLDILQQLGHKIVVETETSLSKLSGY